MNLPTDIELETEAKRRYLRDAKTHPKHRPYSQNNPWDHWYHGLLGERELAALFGVPMNMALLPSGDGKIDFAIWVCPENGIARPLSLDVKCFTYQGPGEKCAIEKAVLNPAVAYVHANHSIRSRVTVLKGWILGSDAKTYPSGFLPGRDILSHLVPVVKLTPMSALLAKFRLAKFCARGSAA